MLGTYTLHRGFFERTKGTITVENEVGKGSVSLLVYPTQHEMLRRSVIYN
jgi:hypothetical protein